MSRFSLFIFFLLIGFTTYAQELYTISGTIQDNKAGALPGAAVYLSGYKIAAVADNDGKFKLSNLKPGNYDVLVQVIGYLPATVNVILSDKSVDIKITLKENVTELKEVVIKPDPDRTYFLNLFKQSFIGATPNAEKCKILNPDVIVLDYDKQRRFLSVTATEMLVIENKALGYRIKYLLQFFENDMRSNTIFFAGHPHFEEMEGSKSQKNRWKKMRDIAYAGSQQHFFKSLYQNKIKEEGFIINKLAKVKNNARPSDSIINAALKKHRRSLNGVIRIGGTTNDSLAYWSQKSREPKFFSTLNRADVRLDTLVKQYYSNLKTINYADALYIIFTKEKETKAYTDLSGFAVSRPLDMPNYQISVAHLQRPPVNFYENGGIFDPRSLLFEGFWAYEKIADMVPMDFEVKNLK